MTSVNEIANKYGRQVQNDATDILADFKRNLPLFYKEAEKLLKSNGVKSPKYIAAFNRFFAELQRLRQVGLEQGKLYTEYKQKLNSKFPKF